MYFSCNLVEIFDQLGTGNTGSKDIYHSIQKYIILDDITSLMAHTSQWLPHLQHHEIRFLSHLVLIFKALGKINLEDDSVAILQTYVNVSKDSHPYRKSQTKNCFYQHLMKHKE